jgi:hypothetical protein
VARGFALIFGGGDTCGGEISLVVANRTLMFKLVMQEVSQLGTQSTDLWAAPRLFCEIHGSSSTPPYGKLYETCES